MCEEYKLSYYLVVLRRMIYIAFTYIHVCMFVHSHIYFISCIKLQLTLHNARIVHSIHMHCRIQHHHHHHFLSTSNIIILDIIISFILFSCLISSLLLQDGQTALHLASSKGKLETVRTLVELRVDKEAKDKVRNLMIMMMMMIMMVMMMMMMMMMMAQIMVK